MEGGSSEPPEPPQSPPLGDQLQSYYELATCNLLFTQT